MSRVGGAGGATREGESHRVVHVRTWSRSKQFMRENHVRKMITCAACRKSTYSHINKAENITWRDSDSEKNRFKKMSHLKIYESCAEKKGKSHEDKMNKMIRVVKVIRRLFFFLWKIYTTRRIVWELKANHVTVTCEGVRHLWGKGEKN